MGPATLALAMSLLGARPAPDGAARVFLSPEAASALVQKSGARVLDARGGDADAPFLPGAVVTSWRDVRAGWLRDGRLTDLEEARAHYAAKGVRADRPVLVVGAAAAGWGEEGRVWWDLRVLGHERVFILDGGVRAWVEAGLQTAEAATAPAPGHLGPPPDASPLRVGAERVLELAAGAGVVLDSRTREEFEGATPFFSARGGHVPGARPLYWKALLTADGRLRPADALRAELDALGVEPGRPVAAYCTGGVRSAFTVAVLTHLGLDAANYDGSWWAWSSNDELPVAVSD